MGLVVLESFNHTLCWYLVHSGILDVKVLVKICWHLVHLQIWTLDITINPPLPGRVQPPPLYILLDRRIKYLCCGLRAQGIPLDSLSYVAVRHKNPASGKCSFLTGVAVIISLFVWCFLSWRCLEQGSLDYCLIGCQQLHGLNNLVHSLRIPFMYFSTFPP